MDISRTNGGGGGGGFKKDGVGRKTNRTKIKYKKIKETLDKCASRAYLRKKKTKKKNTHKSKRIDELKPLVSP